MIQDKPEPFRPLPCFFDGCKSKKKKLGIIAFPKGLLRSSLKFSKVLRNSPKFSEILQILQSSPEFSKFSEIFQSSPKFSNALFRMIAILPKGYKGVQRGTKKATDT